MVFCTSCGAKCVDGARFCNMCGAGLLPAASDAAASSPAPAPTSAAVAAVKSEAAVQNPSRASSAPAPPAAATTGLPCGGCGKLISAADTYAVNALGRRWHKECFKCSQCGDRLFSFSKVYELAPKDGEAFGRPLCAKCNSSTAPFCATCHKRVEGSYVMAMGKAFHSACMKCAGCGKVFGPEGFFEDRGKLWHLTCAVTNQ